MNTLIFFLLVVFGIVSLTLYINVSSKAQKENLDEAIKDWKRNLDNELSSEPYDCRCGNTIKSISNLVEKREMIEVQRGIDDYNNPVEEEVGLRVILYCNYCYKDSPNPHYGDRRTRFMCSIYGSKYGFDKANYNKIEVEYPGERLTDGK